MTYSPSKFVATLARWRRVRWNGVLRLFLAILITLASAASAVPVREVWEAEAGFSQAEEEPAGEGWNAGYHRAAGRSHNRLTAMAMLPPSFFAASAAAFRGSPDHSAPGHLLPNGLRAPLRC